MLFGGKPDVVIPVGKELYSDQVALGIDPADPLLEGRNLAVSFFVKAASGPRDVALLCVLHFLLDRDVFGVVGLRYVVWLEGINDLGACLVSGDDVINGCKDVVEQLHAKKVKAIGATHLRRSGSAFKVHDTGGYKRAAFAVSDPPELWD